MRKPSWLNRSANIVNVMCGEKGNLKTTTESFDHTFQIFKIPRLIPFVHYSLCWITINFKNTAGFQFSPRAAEKHVAISESPSQVIHAKKFYWSPKKILFFFFSKWSTQPSVRVKNLGMTCLISDSNYIVVKTWTRVTRQNLHNPSFTAISNSFGFIWSVRLCFKTILPSQSLARKLANGSHWTNVRAEHQGINCIWIDISIFNASGFALSGYSWNLLLHNFSYRTVRVIYKYRIPYR